MAEIRAYGTFDGRKGVEAAWTNGRVSGDEALLQAAGVTRKMRIPPQEFHDRVVALLKEPAFTSDDFSAHAQQWQERYWLQWRGDHIVTSAKHAAFILCVAVASDLALHASGGWSSIAWVGLVVMFFYVAVTILLADFWHEWTPWVRRWKPRHELRKEVDWALAFVVLTATFALLTALLFDIGVLDGETVIDGHDVLVFTGYYIWHVLDAIPALEIPQTLNWDVPAELQGLGGGALLLAFKLLAIIPIVGALRAFISRS